MSELNLDAFFRFAASNIIQRGIKYYNMKRVKIVSIDSKCAMMKVADSMSFPYIVTMQFDKPAKPYPFQIICNCPHASSMPMLLCKHKVSALLALRDYKLENPVISWRSILNSSKILETPARSQKKSSILLFSIQNSGEWQIKPYSLSETCFQSELPDNINDMRELIRAKNLSAAVKPIYDKRYLAQYTYALPIHTTLLSLLIDREKPYMQSNSAIDIFIPMLKDSLIYLGAESDPLQQPLNVCIDNAQLIISIDKTERGICISGSVISNGAEYKLRDENIHQISESGSWFILDNMLVQIEKTPMLTALISDDIHIDYSDIDDFTSLYLQSMAEKYTITGNFIKNWIDLRENPKPRIYLRQENDTLNAELRFIYGEHELLYDKKLPFVSIKSNYENSSILKIHRKPLQEEQIHKTLASSFGLKKGASPGNFVLRSNVSPLDFLYSYIPKLSENGFEVYGEENIKSVKLNKNKPRISMNISSGIDWFDVDMIVNYGDIRVSIADLKKAVKKNKRFIKLADGSMGHIPDEWFQKFRRILNLTETHDDKLKVSVSQIALIDSILDEIDQFELDALYNQRKEQLLQFKGIESKPLPNDFAGILRDYQVFSYHWLHFLHDYQFGGCLCDDMGVGKTIQTLALLQSFRENGHAKSADLIIMPRSLLINWEREAAKFTPNLKVHIHSGLERISDVNDFNQYDIILTTYGIMRRDIEKLRKYNFHYAILDESQAIKNPLSATGKAARCIKCDHRLTLTGTPVENTTMDLWSQFAFVNPGMLGSSEFFKSEFSIPIERDKDEESAAQLKALVHPFILRRTKEQVAPELPLRTESIIYCEMESSQKKFYAKWRDNYRAILLGIMKDGDSPAVRMKILEGLLRLRQISINPKLISSDYIGPSVKFEAVMEILETLKSEGRKALVFSQFTSALHLLEADIKKAGFNYVYLDGETKDRQARIDRFQNDPSINFFLLSLKAGGVGLNLTAADHVIHMDPWWNPAVERQASDRTHRIGQDKPVFIQKMIAKDTVEEKILILQENKKALSDQIVSVEKNFIKNLSFDDINILFS